MRRRCNPIALTLFALMPTVARAESSIWERARNPSAERVDRALKRVEVVLDGSTQTDDPAMVEDFQKGALAIAEMSGARALGDPRLLLLLAQALLAAEFDREPEASKLLEEALTMLGPADVWLEAEIRPVLAAASRRDAVRAIRAVNRALPLIWDESGRSFLLRERAEARMALGDVRASIADARLALSVASTSAGKALCRFLLGLGLERSGDLPAALREMRLARLLAPAGAEQDLLDMPGVFVLRPLDADYAAGLAARALAEAELVSEPKRALAHYERAIARFATYAKASPRDDRWLADARSQLAVCQRARIELREKLGASGVEEQEEEGP